jgi:hypothetical protein
VVSLVLSAFKRKSTGEASQAGMSRGVPIVILRSRILAIIRLGVLYLARGYVANELG